MTQQTPKTIQIFLPDGNARSIRMADITSRTVQAIAIPRNKLEEAESRPEMHQVGIYFLFYIGLYFQLSQCGRCRCTGAKCQWGGPSGKPQRDKPSMR